MADLEWVTCMEKRGAELIVREGYGDSVTYQIRRNPERVYSVYIIDPEGETQVYAVGLASLTEASEAAERDYVKLMGY